MYTYNVSTVFIDKRLRYSALLAISRGPIRSVVLRGNASARRNIVRTIIETVARHDNSSPQRIPERSSRRKFFDISCRTDFSTYFNRIRLLLDLPRGDTTTTRLYERCADNTRFLPLSPRFSPQIARERRRITCPHLRSRTAASEIRASCPSIISRRYLIVVFVQRIIARCAIKPRAKVFSIVPYPNGCPTSTRFIGVYATKSPVGDSRSALHGKMSASFFAQMSRLDTTSCDLKYRKDSSERAREHLKRKFPQCRNLRIVTYTFATSVLRTVVYIKSFATLFF